MYFLGVDVGYSNLKVAGGDAGGMDIHVRRPAGAGPLADMSAGLDGKALREGVKVQVRGETWVAGVAPERFSTARREIHSEYTRTPMYQALATAGLGFASATRVKRLATGLPVSLYGNKANRRHLKDLLRGTHQVQEGRRVTVDRVLVTVQPLGAFAEAGVGGADPVLLQEGRVAVVDAGFYSLDWVLIDDGGVKADTAGTSLLAMSRLIEAADALIAREHGDSPGPDAIESALRAGVDRMLLFGERVALAPFLSAARRRVAPAGISEMRRGHRDERPIDLVILTGGGAHDYADAVAEAYPRSKTYLSTEPSTANARGYWRIAHEFDAETT